MSATTTNHGPTQMEPSDSFEKWINGRPKWLQSAARLLIDTKRMPNDKEIEWLTELCIREASGEKEGFNQIIPGAFSQAAKKPSTRINKISSVEGVNAIKSGASLSLGDGNLTLIYGANGTGKSGFTRLIKKACGSKSKDELLGNVFLPTSTPASAQVEIKINDKPYVLPWSITEGSLPALRHVQVFDTRAALMYMGKNEASYEPSSMRFVSSLIRICDSVIEILKQKRNGLSSKLPQTPRELSSTNPIRWLNTLSAQTRIETIDLKCKFPKELHEECAAAEAALSQKDASGRLEAIRARKQALGRLKLTLTGLKQRLTSSAINEVITAKKAALDLRRTATEEAKKVFANVDLDGVGQSTWMALWKHAKQFSEQHAYPESEFPNLSSSAQCVLCQQVIQPEATTRMRHFKEYVESALEAEAEKAETKRDELIKRLPILPTEQDWLVQMNLLMLPEDLAVQQHRLLNSTLKSVENSTDMRNVTQYDWGVLETQYSKIISELEKEETALNALQRDEHRQKLTLRLYDLKATRWLNENQPSILEERLRLFSVSMLDKALKLANTHSLSKKNNELAESEISAGYQERFEQELIKLGGKRLPVKPICKREGKGKVTFGLTLIGNQTKIPAEKVLSEGEVRVVALAAFIADMTGSGQQSPFVFDDPISSLDQDFEERVVARLVNLSLERQVIVFTHRLSLLSLVESTTKKVKDRSQPGSPGRLLAVNIETLRRLGKESGVVAKLSLRDAKPIKAASRIQNEFLPQLQKLIDIGEAENFERDAWQVCSEFRILVEKCVENILLNKVLVRFRRDIQTQGRLKALAKIEESDCNFLDDLMSRYSVFEHSQSEQWPGPTPEITVIQQDLTALIDWITNFERR